MYKHFILKRSSQGRLLFHTLVAYFSTHPVGMEILYYSAVTSIRLYVSYLANVTAINSEARLRRNSTETHFTILHVTPQVFIWSVYLYM